MTTITALPTPVPTTADPTNFDARADALLAALPNFVTETNLVAGEVNTNATTATTQAGTSTTQAGISTAQAAAALASANAAAASAASALTAPGVTATSTTSMTPSIGSKAFTLAQTGKTFALGQWVSITDRNLPTTNWMLGPITAFTSGTGAITVNVIQFQGSTVSTNWDIAAAAPIIVPIPVGHTLYLLANYGIF